MIRRLVLTLIVVVANVVLVAQNMVEGATILDGLYEMPDNTSLDSDSSTGSITIDNVIVSTNINFATVAALEVDQQNIVARLASPTNDNMHLAQKLFKKGASSDSFAIVKIRDDDFLNVKVSGGTSVSGITRDGTPIIGYTTRGSDVGENTLTVHYPSSAQCNVGKNPSPITVGCFAPSGRISLSMETSAGFDDDDLANGPPNQSFEYSYEPTYNNYNGLSLATMDDAFRTGPPYDETFTKFVNYYSNKKFDTEWIRSAFEGDSSQAGFSNGAMDFSRLGLEGRGAAIRWGVAVLSVWTFVVNGIEDAVSKCAIRRTDAVDRWDQAVGAYTGSMPLAATSSGGGDGGDGYFLYSLAQTECTNFGTCATGRTGLATVNAQMYESFRTGRQHLMESQCDGAAQAAERIKGLMTIPLVQGIVRLVYALDLQSNSQQTIQGQLAAYAAAILPLLHDCSVGFAFTVYDDLKPGNAVGGSFEVVKDALERSYECLGVTCEDIGGLVNLAGDSFLKGAEPCVGTGTSTGTGVGSGGSTGTGTAPTPAQVISPTRQPAPPPRLPEGSTPDRTSNNYSNSNGSSSSSSTADSRQQLPLVIGLSIGAGVLAAVIAIVVFIFDYKDRKKQYDTAEDTPRARAKAQAQSPSVVDTDANNDNGAAAAAAGNEEEISETPGIV